MKTTIVMIAMMCSVLSLAMYDDDAVEVGDRYFVTVLQPNAKHAKAYGWDTKLVSKDDIEEFSEVRAELVVKAYMGFSDPKETVVIAARALSTFDNLIKETTEKNLTTLPERMKARVSDMWVLGGAKINDKSVLAMHDEREMMQRLFRIILYRSVGDCNTIVTYAMKNPGVKAAGGNAYVLSLVQAYRDGLLGNMSKIWDGKKKVNIENK